MKNEINIKKNNEASHGAWGYFVDVFVNDVCIGTVMTDGTLTAYECYKNLKNNWEIDKLESQFQ